MNLGFINKVEPVSRADKAFCLVLLFVMTQLYRVVGLIAGVDSVAPITAVISAFCIGYLVIKRRITRKPIFYYFLIVGVMIWPIVTALYADSFDSRAVLIQLHYLFLLLAAAAFYINAMSLGKTIAMTAVWISILAMAISVISPDAFSAMAQIASAQFDYLGRGSGLFLQPNLLAYNLILFGLLLARFTSLHEPIKILWISAALLVAVFFTGSRGGIVTALLFVLLWNLSCQRVANPRTVLRLIIAMVILLVVLGCVLLFVNDMDLSLYVDRVMSLVNSNVVDEVSLRERLDYQARFLELSAQRPFFGYGVGSVEAMLERGELYGAAHNQFLDVLFNFGLVGLVLMGISAVAVSRRLARMRTSLGWVTFIVTVTAMMLGTNMVLQMQNFYILIAAILARSHAVARLGTAEATLGLSFGARSNG